MPEGPANSAPQAGRLRQWYLCAGGLLLLTEPGEITTVLGPCVAVTLWNGAVGVAAICHAMLPDAPSGEPRPKDDQRDWKYVSTVVPEMLSRFRAKGGMRGCFQVKLFGGANLAAARPSSAGSRLGVGARNVARALELIAAAGLTITSRDVGGCRGRKLIFNTATGGVRIRTVSGLQPLAA